MTPNELWPATRSPFSVIANSFWCKIPSKKTLKGKSESFLPTRFLQAGSLDAFLSKKSESALVDLRYWFHLEPAGILSLLRCGSGQRQRVARNQMLSSRSAWCSWRFLSS